MKQHPGHVYSDSTPKPNTLTKNNVQQSHVEVKSDGTQRSEWHDVTMSMEQHKVNFDPIKNIGLKVGGGYPFKIGCSFATLP